MRLQFISSARPSQRKFTVNRLATKCLTLLGVLLVAGCAARAPLDGPPRQAGPASLPSDPVPRSEPRSRYGNGPVYEVNGRSYQVMKSADGYQERGVASWYGQKFHGRLTSNRELYDMHALTAAHTTLPLPTYVEVTNLSNGKSVIVRVNDRGPFVSNRIIDLSYAAARRLEMVKTGTSLVEVRALTGSQTVAAKTSPDANANRVAQSSAALYLQVGAFGDPQNADRRLRLLQQGGIGSAFVAADYSASPALYRVRIGPIETVEQYDALAARLVELGIEDTHLVSD